MMRRAGLLGTGNVTLQDLWEDLTVIATEGRNSSSYGRVELRTTKVPDNKTTYLFVFCDGELGIFKCVNRAQTLIAIKRSSLSEANCIYYEVSTVKQYYAYSRTGESSTNVYCATLACVEFPSYSVADVDRVLGSMTLTKIAGANATAAQLYTSDKASYKFIMSTRVASSTVAIDVRDGATWNLIDSAGGTEYAATSITTQSGTQYLFIPDDYTLTGATRGSMIGIN